MNYKETLLFIGKCLTINHEKHNKDDIEKQLISKSVDWDNVVKVSTAQLVFPALYINLKRAEFLSYLPNDLVGYMEHITELNRERNQEIKRQAKRINDFFKKNNITPIFTKGTAFLLLELYQDIGERMVGDIDVLINPNQFEDAVHVAFANNYYSEKKHKIIITEAHIHYPKIIHDNEIAALEIHFDVTRKPYNKDLNYNYLSKSIQNTAEGITTLSFNDHVLVTCFNKQISDNGNWTESFALRNSYDLFLLSKKTSPLNSANDFKRHFNIINNFIASSSALFNNPISLKHQKNSVTQELIQRQLTQLDKGDFLSKKIKFWNTLFYLKNGFKIAIKGIYKRKYREYIISRITSNF